MDNYLSYGELPSSPASTILKGRRRGTIEYVGMQKFPKSQRGLVAHGVQLQHSLAHSNVLKFLEWYETRQHIWVITELASGGTLLDMMELDGPVPPSHLSEFLRDLASGLHYLHSSNVIIVDLHPSSVLLDSTGSLKLANFNLAHYAGDTQWDLKRLSKVLEECFSVISEQTETDLARTLRQASLPPHSPYPFYLAPEVLLSAQFSIASDLWTLGCLLYELITGTSPFGCRTMQELVNGVHHNCPVQIEAEEEEWALVRGLLTKSTVKRWNWSTLTSHPLVHLQ